MPDDNIGPDGYVRLRAYLPHAHIHWLAGTCRNCPRTVSIGIEAAIRMMGSGDATAGELARRLRCQGCGGRVALSVAADSRSVETQRREGRLPETMGVVVRD